jgi:hypothetical protein
VKLNSISIGGGLALVAVGLLANAAASLVGTPERTANADDLKRAAKNPQSVADVAVSRADEMRRAMDGTPPTMPMGGGGVGCDWGKPLEWFGVLRESPECLSLGLPPWGWAPPQSTIERIDVNADGMMEYVGITWGRLVISGVPQTEFVLAWNTAASVVAGSVIFQQQSVLSSAMLLPLLATVQQPFTDAQARVDGFRDLDGDGDMDAVVSISVQYAPPVYGGTTKYAWLENTGYEATQPLVGDLDGDGSVGASDLTMLLGGWTGN